MTDHKPLPVAGYTAQSNDNVALANEGKELEERYLRWLDKLVEVNGLQMFGTPNEMMRFDPRCLAEARTCIQTGAMWAIRSIFQPTRVKLPEDV